MKNGDTISRRAALQAAAALGARPGVGASPAGRPHPAYPDFSLTGAANIVEEEHFGIINGLLSTGVNYRHVGCLGGLYAPPYASSDFRLDLRLWGERIETRDYTWFPREVHTRGSLRNVRVSAAAVLAEGARVQILAVTLHNAGSTRLAVPVQFDVTGRLGYVKEWHFQRPDTRKEKTTSSVSEHRVVLRNEAGAIVLGTDTDGFQWEPWSSHWNAKIELAPAETRVIHVVAAIGDHAKAEQACKDILANPTQAIAQSRRSFKAQVDDLFERLPLLEASDPRLVRYYNRSLLHFVLNQWRVPEFILNPYYSTGSIKGGCVGNYLWDYGGPFRLFPVYDAPAAKEHIKQFLRIDITKHFLFNPIDGKAGGPWYPVNQEKIILLIYHYVVLTGDVAFLRESVNGRTVLEWAVLNATFRDDPSQPAVLVDYGNGNNHLELRRQYRYDNYMPDLNGRRYNNFLLAWRLTEIAGNRQDSLKERAANLRTLLKAELWDPEHKWFAFRFANGKKELRYTVQMYKLIGSGVLDAEQQEGLLSHLNEAEFLSEFGFHSMAKHDPAYDQVDIDNGGGGIYAAFVPRIAELLYQANLPDRAEDLLRRVLWWGDRVPYWSDSFVANQLEYRKDTPLQNQFDATVGGQCVIFGMFGVAVESSGELSVNPRPPRFSPRIHLRGLRLRGHTLDISADSTRFQVIHDGKSIASKVGTPVRIPAKGA